MNTVIKKAAAIAASALTTCALCAAPVLASTTVTGGQATVPVYLTQEATPIDVTIGTDITPLPSTDPTHPNTVPIDFDNDGTPDIYGPNADAIYMYAKANENDADVSSLVIRNNNASSPVFVKGIAINNLQDGYTMNAFNSNFAGFQADSKKIGLSIVSGTDALAAANHDLASAYTSNGDSVAASGTLTYGLDGKTAVTTTAVNLKQVADCVVTVAMTPAP